MSAEPVYDPDGRVAVRLGGGRYLLAMAAVAEVGRCPRLTRVPGLPAWVAGVVNWRGRVLAVLELRPLLGEPAAAAGPRTRLVVCRHADVTFGIVADGVDGLSATGQLVPAPATLAGDAARLVSGQLVTDSGPYGVLDLAAVLRLRDRLPRRTAC